MVIPPTQGNVQEYHELKANSMRAGQLRALVTELHRGEGEQEMTVCSTRPVCARITQPPTLKISRLKQSEKVSWNATLFDFVFFLTSGAESEQTNHSSGQQGFVEHLGTLLA